MIQQVAIWAACGLCWLVVGIYLRIIINPWLWSARVHGNRREWAGAVFMALSAWVAFGALLFSIARSS